MDPRVKFPTSRTTPSLNHICIAKRKNGIMSCDVGLYGLAVMGQNFALNMAQHGFSVCVGNRSPEKVTATVERAKAEGDLPIVGSDSPADFCSKISKPRKIVILVQAGKPVDMTIEALAESLEEGDLIIDGGKYVHKYVWLGFFGSGNTFRWSYSSATFRVWSNRLIHL